MIYPILGLGLLFFCIGFVITENNAQYLLSGYNTLSMEERKKINIKAYIPFFKKFHVVLGISFLAIGLLLHYGVGETASGVFLGTYPLLAYTYFIWRSNSYWRAIKTNKVNKIMIYILPATFLFITGLMAVGLWEDPLIIKQNALEFKGSYGEVIDLSDLQSVELVDQLPTLVSKANGFALGPIKKGYFKTQKGEQVKLILNSDTTPYLQLVKRNGEHLYFSARSHQNVALYETIINMLPKPSTLP